MELSDIGVVGLGVMGANLARNIESRGFRVSVYNRSGGRHSNVLQSFDGGGKFFPTDNLKSFVESISLPRKIIIMVKAGSAVDDVVSELKPLLSKGDIIIDGGNSDFRDTRRRLAEAESSGLLYVGAGISGGEEGALKGASIMPSGSPEAWPKIKRIFTSIAAKAPDGSPCCRWIGPDGSGHFVKTVHNAIEYADMQIIAETYSLLKCSNKLSNSEMAAVFSDWNRGELQSYLVGITADILEVKDSDGSDLVDKILDSASQKGTGKWAVMSALNEAVPFGLISQAVFARFVSAQKDGRVKASGVFSDRCGISSSGSVSVRDAADAMYASKIMAYAQGFSLMRAASETYGWNLDFAGIAKIWRNGCIIRSVFLDKIAAAFESNPKLENMLFDTYFSNAISEKALPWRKIVSEAVLAGIPAPCMCAALSGFDSLRTARSSANILQALRDYFGSHTYERIDRPRGEFFHTDWAAARVAGPLAKITKKI